MRWIKALFVIVVAVAAIAVLIVFTGTVAPFVPRGLPKGIPVAELADGKPHPEILLIAPLPEWIPLPDSGRAITAGVYAPQPPYGAAAVVMVAIDEAPEDYAAAYGRKLEGAGFSVRRLPIGFNLIIDRPEAQFEADEREGGHIVYITMRGAGDAHFAQLTFWNPPVPRL